MNREQKLIDIMFQVALLISDRTYDLYKKSNEEKAEWVAKQLRDCGFDTEPCGASWGVLKNSKPLELKLTPEDMFPLIRNKYPSYTKYIQEDSPSEDLVWVNRGLR